MSSSSDPEERRRRRAVARMHHPDLGGDADAFRAAMAAFERGGSRPSPAPASPADEVRFVRRPRGLARVPAWFRAHRLRTQRRRHPRVS